MIDDFIINNKDLNNKSTLTEEQLEELIQYYNPLLYPIGLKLISPYGTKEDVAECIYDTWYYIWNHYSDYDPAKFVFKNWLFLIFRCRIKNKIKYNLRHYRKYNRLLSEDASFNIEDIFIGQENYKHLLAQIDRLKQPKKTIFKMKFIDGQSPEEISRQLNLPLRKVYYYLYEAKKFIKECLKNDEKKYFY